MGAGAMAKQRDFDGIKITSVSYIKHSTFVLKHLLQLEIKDFNAMGDKRCFR